MKKLLAFALSILMVASLAACGESEGSSNKKDDSVSSQSDVTENETNEPEESSEESTTEEATDEETTEAQSTGDDDTSSAIDLTSTSKEKPVPLGEWAKSAIYAVEDKTYHNVDFRITKITTQSEDADYVKAAIEQNNKVSSEYGQIDVSELKIPSDCELCILDYEVKVPADFPKSDVTGNISSPDEDFTVTTIKGGGIPSADGTSTYIGLSTVSDLTLEKDVDYKPGNTYSFRCFYAMVKGFKDYVFQVTTYPDGTKETSSDLIKYGYFGIK